MNRPMRKPGDAQEEKMRCVEYAAILKSLPYSELIGHCDSDKSAGFPARILEWQYREALLDAYLHSKSDDESRHVLSSRNPLAFLERQAEYALRLAIFLVAKDSNSSEEYLQKVCRKYDDRRQDGGLNSLE